MDERLENLAEKRCKLAHSRLVIFGRVLPLLSLVLAAAALGKTASRFGKQRGSDEHTTGSCVQFLVDASGSSATPSFLGTRPCVKDATLEMTTTTTTFSLRKQMMAEDAKEIEVAAKAAKADGRGGSVPSSTITLPKSATRGIIRLPFLKERQRCTKILNVSFAWFSRHFKTAQPKSLRP